MIVTYADRDTALLASRNRVRRFISIERIALRKLLQLEIASTLSDLAIPPGNRLEQLGGNRKGQYSIRINDKYRICFAWTEFAPANVEIVDYHLKNEVRR